MWVWRNFKMNPYDPLLDPYLVIKSIIYPWLIITFLTGVFVLILVEYLNQKLDPKNKNNILLPRKDFIQNEPPSPMRKFLSVLGLLIYFCISWIKAIIKYHILRIKK